MEQDIREQANERRRSNADAQKQLDQLGVVGDASETRSPVEILQYILAQHGLQDTVLPPDGSKAVRIGPKPKPDSPYLVH